MDPLEPVVELGDAKVVVDVLAVDAPKSNTADPLGPEILLGDAKVVGEVFAVDAPKSNTLDPLEPDIYAVEAPKSNPLLEPDVALGDAKETIFVDVFSDGGNLVPSLVGDEIPIDSSSLSSATVHTVRVPTILGAVDTADVRSFCGFGASATSDTLSFGGLVLVVVEYET